MALSSRCLHWKPAKMLQVGLKFYFWLILRKPCTDIYYYKIISVLVLSNTEYQKAWHWIKNWKEDTTQQIKHWHLFRDSLLKWKKWHSVEPQLFEEIFFSSKIKLETFRSTKCCKFKNVWICDDYIAKEKNKCISSDMSLVLFSVFFKEQKRQSNATEKLY